MSKSILLSADNLIIFKFKFVNLLNDTQITYNGFKYNYLINQDLSSSLIESQDIKELKLC